MVRTIPAWAGTNDVQDSAAVFELPSRAMDPAARDLAERLRRGDPSALAEAYDEHHENVRAFGRRLVGDEATAEDLVQETFLALPRVIKGFRGDSTLRSFILGIAANHARHHVRAASRLRAVHGRSGEEDRDPPSTPEDRTRKRELAEALMRALDELPFEQRLAIVLCEVEERTSVEAAGIVGAPEATIRTRVFHAKKKLRELLSLRGVR